MGKIAFVFSGQGAQFPGMGQALYESVPAARQVFDLAEAARPGTLEQCFAGSEETLQQTGNTQPCMFAVELAAAAAVSEAGIRADMAAGFSLGELAALTYANALSFADGFRLVSLRGGLMQRAAEEFPTAMAAVMKLPDAEVERLCAQFAHMYPVNYNCPGQITVSGAADEMPEFTAAVKAAGGRAVPLKVAGAFHSPYMQSASDAFSQALAQQEFRAPEIPLYANFTGAPYGADVRGTLAQQMCHPVLWETTVRGMIAAGADIFVELGPGRTLCNLIGKTDKSVRCFAISGPDDVAALAAEVQK